MCAYVLIVSLWTISSGNHNNTGNTRNVKRKEIESYVRKWYKWKLRPINQNKILLIGSVENKQTQTFSQIKKVNYHEQRLS